MPSSPSSAPLGGKRVLVTGGRGYDDERAVFAALDMIAATDGIAVVIHGACSKVVKRKRVLCGADGFADQWARSRGAPVISCAADWDLHGHAAGPIRNGEMIRDHHPDLVLAFPGNRGTADCVQQAERKGIPIIHYETSHVR